jgi:hypothetical protein
MSAQSENANYDFQSFDPYPQAPMYPTGWDLSEMQSESKDVETVEIKEDGKSVNM